MRKYNILKTAFWSKIPMLSGVLLFMLWAVPVFAQSIDAGWGKTGASILSSEDLDSLDEGLVGYWKFDEGSGNIAHDYSGNNNHGTIHGATWVDGKCGKALYFDDSYDCVQANPVNVSYLTVASWVNFSGFTDGQGIVSNGECADRHEGYMLYQNPGTPWNCFKCFVTTPQHEDPFDLISSHLLNTNEWYCVAMTYDGTTLRLYINGELDSAINATGAIIPSVNPLLIGSIYWPGNDPFNGIIDEVRIYNRALNEDEIRQLCSQCGCMTVSGLTICADKFVCLGDSTYRAEAKVWVGDSSGQNLYLYLGDSSEVTFNLRERRVTNVVLDSVHLSSKGEDYAVDGIASLAIDAQAGEVSFEGTVHYSEDATFKSSFTGACTLQFNQDSLYGSVQFDDPTFGTLGLQAGGWNLRGCPFFGIHFAINTYIPLTTLSALDGEITIGVFPNTGIFRVGLTNGMCEYYSGAFGLDLTGLLAPPGAPSQGTIDIDFQNWRINVIDDIPIGIPTPAIPKEEDDSHSLGDTSGRVEYVVEKGKKLKIIVDLGMTIKGEEDYTDLNCNGRYDDGEPFEDENSNGTWDAGTNIELKDEGQNPVFNMYGHNTISLSLFHYVHFTVAEAEVSFSHPNTTLSMRHCYGVALGNIFNIDLVQDTFYLDITNKTYYGSAQFRHPLFLPLIFSGDFFLKLDDPKEFSTSIDQGFEINGFINFIPKGSPLRLIDNSGFFTDAVNIVVFDIINTTSKLIIDEAHMKGTFYTDFTIGDNLTLSLEESKYFIEPDQCLSVTAGLKVCPSGFCVGGWLNFRVCDGYWHVNIGGIWVSINCPVNIHVYDSQGRHTGINQYGDIDAEIPGSEFYVFGDSAQQLIFLPDPDLVGGYTIDVEGLADSVFDMDILYPNRADGKAYNVGYFENTTHQGAIHRVNLGVNNNWTMLNDLDGDSVFESQTNPDSTAEAILDTAMVTIKNVSSHTVGNLATISWLTNVPATSEVLYRSEHDTLYKSVSDTILTTSHSVEIDSILTTDTFYYIVVSVDTSGNIASFLEKTFKLQYVTGDVNADGKLTVSDVIYLINYLFKGGPAPVPAPIIGDANCDGKVTVSDVVYLINYLFKSGPSPCK